MELRFTIIDGVYEDLFSVEFYEDSAHVTQLTENGTLGFFIEYKDFENPERWHWYPVKAADYIKRIYKNKVFL